MKTKTGKLKNRQFKKQKTGKKKKTPKITLGELRQMAEAITTKKMQTKVFEEN